MWAHSDATIDTLALDAIGDVPWRSGDRNEVTRHRILVHRIAETDRHAGTQIIWKPRRDQPDEDVGGPAWLKASVPLGDEG